MKSIKKILIFIFIFIILFILYNRRYKIQVENFSNKNIIIFNPTIDKDIIKCKVNFKGKLITLKNEYEGINDIYDGVEGFLCLFIPHAILSGDTIILKKPICRKFLNNLKNVKKYYESKLNKKFTLNIQCELYDKKYEKKKGISTFTGGVDSFYTILKENKNISTVFYCINYDIKETQKNLLEKQLKTVKDVAQKLKKNVIICKTNQKQVLESIKYENMGYGIWGYLIHGVCIFSNVYNLSNEYSDFYFPSSQEVEINSIWGSSLYLDKYYSSENLNIVNEDSAGRNDKLKYIIKKNKNIVFKYLKVCWKNPNQEYNCSKCEKCLRTIIPIGIMDKKNLKKLETFKIDNFDKILNDYLSMKFKQKSDIYFQKEIRLMIKN